MFWRKVLHWGLSFRSGIAGWVKITLSSCLWGCPRWISPWNRLGGYRRRCSVGCSQWRCCGPVPRGPRGEWARRLWPGSPCAFGFVRCTVWLWKLKKPFIITLKYITVNNDSQKMVFVILNHHIDATSRWEAILNIRSQGLLQPKISNISLALTFVSDVGIYLLFRCYMIRLTVEDVLIGIWGYLCYIEAELGLYPGILLSSLPSVLLL